jgi:hypothetical protein
MCCRVEVQPIGPRSVEILGMIGFKQETDSTWVYYLDGDISWVTARTDPPYRVILNVYPPVGSIGDHTVQRLGAAIMFKVAHFLAEDSKGEILQQASVSQCLVESGSSSRMIGTYPSQPIRFEAICVGFREVFTQGGQNDYIGDSK